MFIFCLRPTRLLTIARKFSSVMKIGTHSGTFHCDEALAVYMLKTLPTYKDASVTRSRDNDTLEACDIIVDVTGKYDGVKHFDHHQREFNETFDAAHKTKLSSAGLVYKHFGKDIISTLSSLPKDDKNMNLIYVKVYDEFIEGIDANDNGISAYGDLEPSFKTPLSLPSMVSYLNPRWNEPSNDALLDTKFKTASDLVGSYFADRVDYFATSWLPARSGVLTAITARPHPAIVLFEEFMPWKDHLFQIEQELQVTGTLLYVVYSDGKGWRVQAVPKSVSSFESRKALPERWRGIRDAELDQLTGVPGGVFVHASGFIGGHKTKEGAMELARLSLNQ